MVSLNTQSSYFGPGRMKPPGPFYLRNSSGSCRAICWRLGDGHLQRSGPGRKPGLTKFEFVINLTTAKALGLTIPASFPSLADELIE